MEHMRKDIKNPQVGGTHYSDKGIEPIEYICANNMDFCEGNIVKYVTRHAERGKDADIKKTIQYALFMIMLQGNPPLKWWEELQQALCLVKHYFQFSLCKCKGFS